MNITITIVLIRIRFICELNEISFNKKTKGRKKNISWEIKCASNSFIVIDDWLDKDLIMRNDFFKVDDFPINFL
jgi:hypothetical protein